MCDQPSPTPYPYVNVVLHRLLGEVRRILGKRFFGLYLYGSLASGGFTPQRSDIDFVVVTEGLLPPETIAALGELHARLASSGDKWCEKLEGAYVPRSLLRRYDPQAPDLPQVNEGEFYQAKLGSDWVFQYHTLREQCLAVDGPSLREWIDPVSPPDLRQAVKHLLSEWWAPMLADPRFLRRSDYQAYAVLSLCRALHLLQAGGLLSKVEAARWSRQALDARWQSLVAWAEVWPAEPGDHLEEVLALLRYTLEVSQGDFPAPCHP